MRTAHFLGNCIGAALALAVLVALLTQWLRFVLSVDGGTGLATLFLWLVLGVNITVWAMVGMVRFGDDSVRALAARTRRRKRPRRFGEPGRYHATGTHHHGHTSASNNPNGEGSTGNGAEPTTTTTPQDPTLAVIIPAHNEEPVIADAISSALRLFHHRDVYVVSDSSQDRTADIASATGANVLELHTNHGKAGALDAAIRTFELTERYDAVVLLDADTELGAGYVRGVREQLRDPKVAAVAGFVVADWDPARRTVVGRLISAYRDRLYWMLQYLLRFGQTWRHTSVTSIVPGFASAYRSSALRQVNINPKGLVIEDFNMTFEVHHKRLGRISMRPGTKAYCQDPFTLGDYVKQVRRWTLGFWQTVRLHGPWLSLFWIALACYILEILFVALLLLTTACLAVFTLIPALTDGAVLSLGWYAAGYEAVTAALPLTAVAVGLLVPDYILTCVLATLRRRPSYLVYGLFFLPLRLVDAYLILRTIPQSWTTDSDGRWSSPGRAATRL